MRRVVIVTLVLLAVFLAIGLLVFQHARERKLAIVEGFLAARSSGNLVLASSYLSQKIIWRTAVGCTYKGKDQAFAFLQKLKEMQLKDVIISGPKFDGDSIRLSRQMTSFVWQAVGIDSLVEIDQVTVDGGHVRVWNAKFSTLSLSKLTPAQRSKLIVCSG